jgi:hypothetical protein
MRSAAVSLAIALACIAAAGCSSMSMHTQQLVPVLDPYVGQPVSEFVNRFGPPSDDYSSSAVATTYQWDNFGTGQSGMTGCRVLVVAHRNTQGNGAAAEAFRADPIAPEEYTKWTIESWSSFGSGCR